MKTVIKKSTAILLAFVLMIAIVPIQASALTENDVVSWMNSKNGTTINDGGTQCVAAFNSYLRLWGISNPISKYPVNYAYQIFNYNAPDGWQKISGSGNYRVGDVVVWGSSVGGGCGHVGMVYSTSGGTVKIFDQNYVTKNVCGIHNIAQTSAIRGVFRPPLNTNPPTNVYLDKNQYWYDIQDTITLYPHAEGADYYWLSVYKGDDHIVDQAIYGDYSFSAGTWGYGDYYAWITAANSAGGTDSAGISFSVVGAPTYENVWTSKGFYDWDENEKIEINVSAFCSKGQCIGIDFLDNELNYVQRIVTENCGTTYTISAKTLGIGYFSAYFSVYNGSGGIDTKRVYFYVGQKKDIGAEFCAKIKNINADKYLTAVENNVEGKNENCDKQQVWFFCRLSDGSYKIKNYYDWRALDVNNYADAGAGTNVQVYDDWDSTAQRFYIYEVCGAYYIKPVCTDMVLDLNQTTYNLEVWGAGFDWAPQKFEIEKIETDEIGVHKYTDKTVAPTEDNDGYTEHTCTICGYAYKDSYTHLDNLNSEEITISLSSDNYVYDGEAKTPTVTIKNDTVTLVEDTDYSVECFNNTNVGTATVIVTGLGDYCGTVVLAFSISEPTEPSTTEPTTEPTPDYKFEDVNLDGFVNVKDVVLIQRIVVEEAGLSVTDKQKELADINGDGDISVKDATALQIIIVNS